MDAHRDPVSLGDAVLLSDDEAADALPPSAPKLLSDFPAPLTEPQRRAVLRHVALQMRDYEAVRQQVAVVELGYLALLRVVKRLRREHAQLQASLNPNESGEALSKTPTVSSPPVTVDPPAASATKEAAMGPKRRPGGLLLRSAVFSGLQRVLQTAKSEQHDEKAAQLARQRERIAKESRLHLLAEDLASQEALLAPLAQKYSRAATFGQEAIQKAGTLLTLLEDMWRLETLYPSRFSLHAAGPLEPLLRSGDVDGSNAGGVGSRDEANEEAERGSKGNTDGAALAAAGNVSASTHSPQLAVPFTPAQYTSEVEDRIRAQVEGVIDEYLAYRTRMDPVLYQLEQAQQAVKAQKVDRLMDLIAVKGAEVDGGSALFRSGGPTAEGVLSYAPGEKSAHALMNISASEEDEDVLVAAAEGETADKDRQDREHIRTALTALDDFEDA